MTEGMKRAALALHGVSESDRAWVLERMSPAERIAVAKLLEELRELGIPGMNMPAGVPTPAERVRAARPSQVVSVLRRESPRLVASCLAIEAWPWRDAVLAKLPRRRRAAVLQAARDIDAAPAASLDAVLVEELDRRLSLPRTSRWAPWRKRR